MQRKSVTLVMKKYVIEPLGVMGLGGTAKEVGWDVNVFLYESIAGKFDFELLYEEVRSSRPDLVGFSVWTGAHLQSFAAADKIRSMGIPVAIGGPHATYYTEECARHADMVAKGEGFRIFRQILTGQSFPGVREIAPGIFFDTEPKAEPFPMPNREVVYRRYPDLGASPIKSIMCSTGCPFHCSYCNSPHLNDMYKKPGELSGFKNVFRVRPVDDIVKEALYVRDNWGVKMFYFQDDIFGYDMKWLAEFSKRWKKEVGVPWHCQVRLELVRGEPGDRRLELFCEGGCGGITLAIESGDDFLREFVLLRPMPHELIVEGCKKIMNYGLTLRTEQILQVAFSNLETDLATLALNCEINPNLAWVSILHPFGETNMGKITNRFLFYLGNNDDFYEEFYFDYSHLRHSETAKASIERVVRELARGTMRFDSPLLRMYAKTRDDNTDIADVFVDNKDLVQLGGTAPRPLCEIRFMSPEENTRYCDQTSRLQRIFSWLAKVPRGYELGAKWTALLKHEWTWKKLGELTEEHLVKCGYAHMLPEWKHRLASKFGCGPTELPEGIRDNPYYFCFFPSGHEFARRVKDKALFDLEPWKFFDALGGEARHWLFNRSLYKVEPSEPPIAP